MTIGCGLVVGKRRGKHRGQPSLWDEKIVG
jgi:hypothetical protein